MSGSAEEDSLSLEFQGLTIRISKTPDRRNPGSCTASGAGFTVVTEEPPSSSLASPARGTRPAEAAGYATQPAAGVARRERADPWSWEWESLLIAAHSPSDFECLDLSPIDHLVSRLRATSGGWSPRARLGRALRAGLIARARLEGRPGEGYLTGPDIPLENRFYIVLRGAPGKEFGWTDHYLTFLTAVRGEHSRFHREAVCHAFSSRTEAEAYCLGAGASWPAPLQRVA